VWSCPPCVSPKMDAQGIRSRTGLFFLHARCRRLCFSSGSILTGTGKRAEGGGGVGTGALPGGSCCLITTLISRQQEMANWRVLNPCRRGERGARMHSTVHSLHRPVLQYWLEFYFILNKSVYLCSLSIDGHVCLNSNRRLPFIVCGPRKTNLRLPFSFSVCSKQTEVAVFR
jgi:hypothetical protein